MVSALEQVSKPSPAKGREIEAAPTEDIVCISTCFCSSILDGLSSADFLQVIKH
jgi:hypothetical protein